MKAIMLFVFLGILSGIGFGQEKTGAPVSLNIFPLKIQVCLGEPLHISATLRNTGSVPIVIDTKKIGVQPTYWRSIRSKSGRFVMEWYDEISSSTRDDTAGFAILAPSEARSVKLTYFIEKKAFTSTGKYSFKVGYSQFAEVEFNGVSVWVGSVDSNDVDIIAKRCRGTKKFPSSPPSQ